MTRGESRSTPVPAGVLSAMMSGTPMKPLSSVTCLVLQGNELTTSLISSNPHKPEV